MGVLWVCQQFGMPFGAVASVMAWHRVGNFLTCVARRRLRLIVGRYVDDWFGASRSGLRCSPAYCMAALMRLTGFDDDPVKTVDRALRYVVLGAQVSI